MIKKRKAVEKMVVGGEGKTRKKSKERKKGEETKKSKKRQRIKKINKREDKQYR